MPGGSLYAPRTKERLTAEFKTLVPLIQNEINLKESIRVWQHCRRCAQHTETNFDPQNYLYIVMNNRLWPYFSMRQYPAAPQDPGDNPSYAHGEEPTHNQTIRDTWELANKHFQENKNMNAALVARFLRLIPEANRTAFEENQLTNNPKMRFLQVFDYFWDNYGDASEEEIVENIAKLLDPWQP